MRTAAIRAPARQWDAYWFTPLLSGWYVAFPPERHQPSSPPRTTTTRGRHSSVYSPPIAFVSKPSSIISQTSRSNTTQNYQYKTIIRSCFKFWIVSAAKTEIKTRHRVTTPGACFKFVTQRGGGLKPWKNFILLEPNWTSYGQLGGFWRTLGGLCLLVWNTLPYVLVYNNTFCIRKYTINMNNVITGKNIHESREQEWLAIGGAWLEVNSLKNT